MMAESFDDEFAVNTVTQGRQGDQAVVRLANGRFVVVWTDDSQIGVDWDGGAIKAQIFDADGARIGGEFLVNAFIRGGQGSPAVTALTNGSFVVSWTTDWVDSAGGGDGSGSAVKGRVFDPDGNPLSAEFLVNDVTALDQGSSSLFQTNSGGFWVTWQSDTPGGDVDLKSRRFESNGFSLGGELDVTETVAGSQVEPDGILLVPGRYLIAWTDGNSNEGDVKAAYFSSQGQGTGRRISSEFVVHSVVDGAQGQPDVAAFSGGGFVVAWSSLEGETVRARAQVFNGDGDDSRSGPEILLSQAGHTISSPKVVVLASGAFVIAWIDRDPAQDPPGAATLLGQHFTPDGERLGMPVILSRGAVDPLGAIDLADAGQNRLVAVWINAAGEISGRLLEGPLIGTDEYDFLRGGSGDDTLFGGGGSDVLYGNEGDDRLIGGDGYDTLSGGAGVDSFDGSSEPSSSDRVSFFEQRATQGVVADLRTGIISNDGFGNVETMTGIESLGGDTAYVDTFYGNDSAICCAAASATVVYGFGGDDDLQVHAAASLVDGGDGIG